MKILLVDDDNTMRRALFLGLKNIGYETDEVSHPIDALKKVDVDHYDLIIVDFNMSLISGGGLIKLLNRSNNKTPVLIISSESRFKIESSGVDPNSVQIISKDQPITVILENIEIFLKKQVFN
jgi:DNA-binding response OmpR family regulator